MGNGTEREFYCLSHLEGRGQALQLRERGGGVQLIQVA